MRITAGRRRQWYIQLVVRIHILAELGDNLLVDLLFDLWMLAETVE